MFAAALIVFREPLEASLIISIMAAAARGIPWRGRWILGAIFAGIAGAALVATGMEAISEMASGMGQELFNAAILTLAAGCWLGTTSGCRSVAVKWRRKR